MIPYYLQWRLIHNFISSFSLPFSLYQYIYNLMRFDIELQVKGLRCLKGLFNTILKVIFSSKEKASIFLVYFLEPKQIRFLVNSENCMAILAIDPRISISDKSSKKEGSELLVIQFKDGEALLRSLCELVQKEGVGDVTLALSKDKSKPGEQPFRSLNLLFANIKYRNEVFKPLYDPDSILNHQWLNGCASPDWRKVQFDIDTEHLLNILRVLVRYKETSTKERLARVIFQFSQSRVCAQLERFKHNSYGQITYHSFRAQKYDGDYTYTIKTEYAAKIYELFLGKSSGSKLFIDTHNRIVFSYYQEGVFESQVLLKDWMMFESFSGQQPASRPKLEI